MTALSGVSCTSTPFDLHVRNNFGVDVALIVQVNYLEVRGLFGDAAARVRPLSLLHDVSVRAGVELVALAGAVVGLVVGRRDDPVPPELLEVHDERLETAGRPLFPGPSVAEVLTRSALVAILTQAIHFEFNERNLAKLKKRQISQKDSGANVTSAFPCDNSRFHFHLRPLSSMACTLSGYFL